MTVEPLTVAPSFGSTILSEGLASSCSPRAACISLTFGGRSTSVSVCAAGDAAGEAAAFAFSPAFLFMSEEQPASAAAQMSAQASGMSRESFILSSCHLPIAHCGLRIAD